MRKIYDSLRRHMQLPRFWGVSFAIVIIVFAIIYYAFPDDSFSAKLNSILDSLYLSVVTITTLGFGDYCPASDWAKTLVVVESLLGVSILGMFLNAVAHSQSVRDDEFYKKLQEAEKFEIDRDTLLRCDSMVEIALEDLSECLGIVSTPAVKRGAIFDKNGKELNRTYVFEPNFDYKILADIYAPTMRLRDVNRKTAECLYESIERVKNLLRMMLLNANLRRWPDLDQLIRNFLSLSERFDNSYVILQVCRSQSHIDADISLLKNWNLDFCYHTSNTINYYVSLYNLLHISHEFLIEYKKCIKRIAEI